LNKPLTLVFIYSGPFMERVIRNLINDPSFCKSCGLHCDSCKYGAYSYVNNIRAAIELPSPSSLPTFIDEPEKYMPKKLPQADLCIASGLHKDLLLELPSYVKRFSIKGLIVPIEDFNEVPSGLKKQLESICNELNIEVALPKPFCSLAEDAEKPTISRLVTELRIGYPEVEVVTSKRGKAEFIEYAIVRRSAPCGSTWYVARKLRGVEVKKELLYNAIAKAHHSYPCTATMNVDPEVNEPILHLAGFIIRGAIEKALEKRNLSQ